MFLFSGGQNWNDSWLACSVNSEYNDGNPSLKSSKSEPVKIDVSPSK